MQGSHKRCARSAHLNIEQGLGWLKKMKNQYDVPTSHLLHPYLYPYVSLTCCMQRPRRKKMCMNTFALLVPQMVYDFPAGPLHATNIFLHTDNLYPPIRAVVQRGQRELLASVFFVFFPQGDKAHEYITLSIKS